MSNQEIYEMVENYVKENLAGIPFDKGLPQLQDFLWGLGDKIGLSGPEVLRIYFDIASKEK